LTSAQRRKIPACNLHHREPHHSERTDEEKRANRYFAATNEAFDLLARRPGAGGRPIKRQRKYLAAFDRVTPPPLPALKTEARRPLATVANHWQASTVNIREDA